MGPTIRQWRLSSELRRLRERANMTQEQVVAATGISRSTLHRLESSGIPKLRDLRTLLELYQASKEERCDLEQTVRQAKERGWWASEPYSGALLDGLSLYFSLEDGAKTLRRWLSTGIHGLLQTPDYARAAETGWRGSNTTLAEERVQLRLERQRRAFERSPRIHTIMDEAVLHRVLGDHQVMVWQLRHLIELAKDPAKHVTVQILPFHSGFPFQSSADFTIFDLDSDQFACDDGTFGVAYYDRPDQVSQLMLTFGALSSGALSSVASQDLIEAIAKEYEQRGR